MKTKSLIVSLLVAGSIGVISPAFAFQKEQFQGEFFNIRINTTVKKNHSINITGSAPFSLNSSSIKADTGKNTCYSGLDWLGDALNTDSLDVNKYQLLTVCLTGGAWELASSTPLDLLLDGSLGATAGNIAAPLNGTSFYSTNPVFVTYQGTIVLLASFKSDGSTKNIKFVAPQDAVIFYSDNGEQIFGSAKSGLTFKRVDLTKVPEGAQNCFNGVIDPTDTTDDPKCPLAEWQTVVTP
jgi:hypothetical protein